jgi:BirA family biotin operon repressor/biotin-[acetyl-CoA-carboxylase] ligase
MMKACNIENPFSAPVYYRETVSSTMDEARHLAAHGERHGTVIIAGFQKEGRGRGRGRPWNADRGKNLFFTILLRYDNINAVPKAITLRTGLAVSLAVEDFAPALKGRVQIKWPNDIMVLGTRADAHKESACAGEAAKAAGILTESVTDASGCTVYIGVGVNLAQTEFPEAFRSKVTSLFLAQQTPRLTENTAGPLSRAAYTGEDRFPLLEKILVRLYLEITREQSRADWRERLNARLYRHKERVRFFAGGADTGEQVEGVLTGIGETGELLIMVDGETETRAFITGELAVYGA